MTMTDTELEDLVVATLRAKGKQVPTSAGVFDPHLVALTPLVGRSRRPMPALVAAAVALVVAVAIGVALVLVDRDQTAEPASPRPEPVAHFEIQALPSLTFQAREFTTVPGLNEIDFVSTGGTHRLVFEDPALADFGLLAATEHQITSGRVELAPGRDYTVFCAIPGHRQAGMEAVIHVSDGPATTTTRPETTTTTLPGSATTATSFPSTTTLLATTTTTPFPSTTTLPPKSTRTTTP
jgi:plastocyanin